MPKADRLILLIPTHNRPSNFKRTVHFISMQAKRLSIRIDIHVLDSSEPENFILNQYALSTLFSEFTVHHHNCGGMNIYQKFNKFYRDQKDALVCTIGDDDFINLEVLATSFKFLSENAEYASVNGEILTVNFARSKYFRYQEYEQSGCSLDSPYDRVLDGLTNYTNNFYTVARVTRLRDYWIELFDVDIGRSLRERLGTFATLLCGKRKIFKTVGLIRDKSTQTGYDEFGNRTLDDDPSSDNYLDAISYGFYDYEQILLRWLGLSSSSTKLTSLLIADLEKWRRKKSNSVVDYLTSIKARIHGGYKLLGKQAPEFTNSVDAFVARYPD